MKFSTQAFLLALSVLDLGQSRTIPVKSQHDLARRDADRVSNFFVPAIVERAAKPATTAKGDPNDLDSPESPDDPTSPDAPTTPDDPTAPDNPDTPDTPDTPAPKPTSTPKTCKRSDGCADVSMDLGTESGSGQEFESEGDDSGMQSSSSDERPTLNPAIRTSFKAKLDAALKDPNSAQNAKLPQVKDNPYYKVMSDEPASPAIDNVDYPTSLDALMGVPDIKVDPRKDDWKKYFVGPANDERNIFTIFKSYSSPSQKAHVLRNMQSTLDQSPTDRTPASEMLYSSLPAGKQRETKFLIHQIVSSGSELHIKDWYKENPALDKFSMTTFSESDTGRKGEYFNKFIDGPNGKLNPLSVSYPIPRALKIFSKIGCHY